MNTLAWTPELSLNHALLDNTHEEFVDLLNRVGQALDDGADALPPFKALLAHTEEHFAMEARWMQQCGFDDANCHTRQHDMVLNIMREVVRYAEELNDREPLSIARTELAVWFANHASSMDAGLVHSMTELGFDPVTGQCKVSRAEASPELAPCHTPQSACSTSVNPA